MSEYKPCPECGGHGTLEYCVPKPDYIRGGDMVAEWGICEYCNGRGEVEDEAWDGEE